jgi:hypothetical protein
MSGLSSDTLYVVAQDHSSAGIDGIEDGDAKPSAMVQFNHGNDAKPNLTDRIDHVTDPTNVQDPNDDDTSTIEAKKLKQRRKSKKTI